MSLQTNDVGLLFDAFEKAYGHQWKQDLDALPLWQNALKLFSPQEVAVAIPKAIQAYADFPPSLGQFINTLRANRPMYGGSPQIEGPKVSDTMALANRIMLKVLLTSCGVQKLTLRAMIDLKNALAHDFEGMGDDSFPATLDGELTKLVGGYEEGAENV